MNCFLTLLLAVVLFQTASAVALPIGTPTSSSQSNSSLLTNILSNLGPAADREIASLQEQVRKSPDNIAHLEKLGWLFIGKSRVGQGNRFSELAGHCATLIEQLQPNSPEALLIRGHLLHKDHSFSEAEVLAEQLVRKRGLPADWALLGDILFDQGKLSRATEVYQKMIDLRPGLQSYSRGAQVRWINGDLSGAIEVMELAVRAGTLRDPEPLAWASCKLAIFHLQNDDLENALTVADAAHELLPEYAPAHFAKARIAWAGGLTNEAVKFARSAAALASHPEYHWYLADLLQVSGAASAAREVRQKLEESGLFEDPRTFALYLCSRKLRLKQALQLARRELVKRNDIFTHDALAAALLANGQIQEADVAIRKALLPGTIDARLFLHAALISEAGGQKERARDMAARAHDASSMLFPLEQQQLKEIEGRLGQTIPLAINKEDKK